MTHQEIGRGERECRLTIIVAVITSTVSSPTMRDVMILGTKAINFEFSVAKKIKEEERSLLSNHIRKLFFHKFLLHLKYNVKYQLYLYSKSSNE